MIYHIEELYSGTLSAGTTTTQSTPVITKYDKEADVFLNISAVTGTSPTLDITVQTYNSKRDTWHTLATFSTKTGTGNDVGYVAENIGEQMAISAVVGGTNTPTFTCTLDVGLKNH